MFDPYFFPHFAFLLTAMFRALTTSLESDFSLTCCESRAMIMKNDADFRFFPVCFFFLPFSFTSNNLRVPFVLVFLLSAFGRSASAHARRYMPPVTPSTWKSTRLADRFSPVCPQLPPVAPTGPEALLEIPRERLAQIRRLLPLLANQSEDCLYLNLYVPRTGQCIISASFNSFRANREKEDNLHLNEHNVNIVGPKTVKLVKSFRTRRQANDHVSEETTRNETKTQRNSKKK